jgi:hypothetical protein
LTAYQIIPSKRTMLIGVAAAAKVMEVTLARLGSMLRNSYG